MFQAWAVKMAKIAAHSAPSSLPGNRPMKKVTVKVRKPSTGTDCRMSSAGMMTSSALRLLAASVATTKVKSSEADDRREHAQRRAQRVVRQAGGIERDSARPGGRSAGGPSAARRARPTRPARDQEDGGEVAAGRGELPPRKSGEQRRAHALRKLKRHEPVLASRVLVSTASRVCPSRDRDSPTVTADHAIWESSGRRRLAFQEPAVCVTDALGEGDAPPPSQML